MKIKDLNTLPNTSLTGSIVLPCSDPSGNNAAVGIKLSDLQTWINVPQVFANNDYLRKTNDVDAEGKPIINGQTVNDNIAFANGVTINKGSRQINIAGVLFGDSVNDSANNVALRNDSAQLEFRIGSNGSTDNPRRTWYAGVKTGNSSFQDPRSEDQSATVTTYNPKMYLGRYYADDSDSPGKWRGLFIDKVGDSGVVNGTFTAGFTKMYPIVDAEGNLSTSKIKVGTTISRTGITIQNQDDLNATPTLEIGTDFIKIGNTVLDEDKLSKLLALLPNE